MRITGIRDIDKEIVLRIERDKDFLKCRGLNSYINSFYDEYMFMRRMKRKYPDVKKKEKTWREEYMNTIDFVLKLKKSHNFNFQTGNPKHYLRIFSHPMKFAYQSYLVGKHNYCDVFPLLNPQDRSHFLDGAAHGGQLNLVKELILLGGFTNDDYNTALCSAIKHNHRPIIDLFLSLGANDYREFLIEAVKYDHQDLINLFQSFL